ncbi:MFS transporter [Vibrio comitans]|uniref:MFS transporter n=1 Tax=Vibrio comitans TaxID=413401 RepID=UPI00114473A8|nr:sugar MFS transporter [Vibrio comitans]
MKPNAFSVSSLNALSLASLAWGLLTVYIVTVAPYIANIFDISLSAALTVSLLYFSPRLLVSIPTARLIRAFGYLVVHRLSTLLVAFFFGLFVFSIAIEQFWLLLCSTFFLGSAACACQVVGFPLISLTGDSTKSTQRQRYASAWNGLGNVIAPLLIGASIWIAPIVGSDSILISTVIAGGLITSYMVVLFIISCQTEFSIQRSDASYTSPQGNNNYRQLLTNGGFLLSLVMLLFGWGLESGMGTMVVAVFQDESIANRLLGYEVIATSLYWVFIFFGRLFISRFGKNWSAESVISLFSMMGIVITSLFLVLELPFIALLVTLLGLCHAGLYPNLYALSLNKSGPHLSQAGALITMCSIGNAIIPLSQSFLVEAIGLKFSFVLPLTLYTSIFFFINYSNLTKERPLIT